MQLRPEYYKGRTISFVQKIIGANPTVIGRWWFQGKIQQIQGGSKLDVLSKIKRMIDKY